MNNLRIENIFVYLQKFSEDVDENKQNLEDESMKCLFTRRVDETLKYPPFSEQNKIRRKLISDDNEFSFGGSL